MSRAWEQYEEIPASTIVRRRDGTSATEPLRPALDGELVVRVLSAPEPVSPDVAGAVVEVVRVQEKDELVLGDRLWIFDRAPCGHCELCRRDHAGACPDLGRIFIDHPDSGHLVVPPWIARRGRVRLPQLLSDDAAAEMGRHAGLLRALRLRAPANPLRILVVDPVKVDRFAGVFLETLWPDARRVLLGSGSADGFHGASVDPAEALSILEEPADLVLCRGGSDLAGLAPLLASGAAILLADGATPPAADVPWAREISVASTRGAVPDDFEHYRRRFEAFGARWDALASSARTPSEG